MNHYQHHIPRFVLTLMAWLYMVAAQAQPMPDALPVARYTSQASTAPAVMETPCGEEPVASLELTVENLLAVLEAYGVKHKEVVAAQAVLETGNFSSELCLNSHNLFGLRHPSDGSYYTFDRWEESVKAYRDDVQYKYEGGDYYAFLNRIGYAEDRRYTAKVRRIEKRIAPAVAKPEED